MIYDVFVAGVGVMGGAVARALARAGLRVAGCDNRQPPHDRGASHGESRIIRAAYFEDPVYAPLARRALTLWRALEEETGRSLLRVTGGLNIGPDAGSLVRGALASARSHGIPHERVGGAELMRRYPALRVGAGEVAVFEPDAGILDPEQCVSAQIESARAAGAQLRLGDRLVGWRRVGAELRITTASGECTARRLVLALGAWLPAFRPGLPLQVTRQPVFWFDPIEPAIHAPERLPHFLIEFEPHRVFYGFPDLGSGLKCAIHREGEITTAEGVDRTLRPSEQKTVRSLLERFLPRAAGALRDSAVCLYTNTADGHFLIDRDPAEPAVWLLSACSGHGFKFAPALAELLLEPLAGRGGAPLEPFSLGRLIAPARAIGSSSSGQ
jgi:sarcosine oxidase